jgi:hypothetical protein
MADTLAAARRRVREHVAEYDAAALAARITATAYANGRGFREAYDAYRRATRLSEAGVPGRQVQASLADAVRILKAMQAPIDAAARAASAEWTRTRHPRDRKKDNSSPYIRQRGAKALLPILSGCSKYLSRLIRVARRARPPITW